jgi:hypothetical protein
VSFEQWESVTRPSGAGLRERRRQFVEAHREWLEAGRSRAFANRVPSSWMRSTPS